MCIIYIHTHIYVYLYVCIYTYIPVCIYMYTCSKLPNLLGFSSKKTVYINCRLTLYLLRDIHPYTYKNRYIYIHIHLHLMCDMTHISHRYMCRICKALYINCIVVYSDNTNPSNSRSFVKKGRVYKYIYLCMYIYEYAYLYVYLYIYVYIYTYVSTI